MPEKTKACAYPWQQMNIDLTGEVVPCCFWSGYANSGKPLGNTNEQTIEEIWNGEAYRELRRRNASGDLEGHPCHQCLAWQWADGHYPGFSWPSTFTPETGHCYQWGIPAPLLEAARSTGAPIVVCEDGVPLSEPDAVHDHIREQGRGRYSVWGDTLYFSSSDNSDPRANGRLYELRCGGQVVEAPRVDVEVVSGRNLVAAHEEYEAGVEIMEAKPSMLSFIATADCNIDCPACSQNTVRLMKVQHRGRTELDVLALVPYLEQLIWHGGEPYLIKHFREFVDSFRTEDNPNLTFGFTSNGTLLNEAELDKLSKFPRIDASVSCDSFNRETFDVMRAGANYETVLANVLRAVERYEAPRFVLSVGMIITKRNVTELPENLAFAMEHGIGLNLSPVVVYPVTERIDVFTNYRAQTFGWEEALDRADEVLARARAEGRVALKRIDPSGMVAALRRIVHEAAERYREVLPLFVTVDDPSGSLPKMRNPGLIVSLVGGQSLPLAYVAFDRGPGRYQLQLPLSELKGDAGIGWHLCHDLLEPMGYVDHEWFVDHNMRAVHQSGWQEMPTELYVEIPPFEPVPRPRNASVSNRGLPTPDGFHLREPGEVFEAYQALVLAEEAEGRGLQAVGHREVFLRDFRHRLDAIRYDGYVSLSG